MEMTFNKAFRLRHLLGKKHFTLFSKDWKFPFSFFPFLENSSGKPAIFGNAP